MKKEYSKSSARSGIQRAYINDMLTYTIRKNEYGEYVVRFRLNGVSKPEWTYFATERQDAINTALDVLYKNDSRVAWVSDRKA